MVRKSLVGYVAVAGLVATLGAALAASCGGKRRADPDAGPVDAGFDAMEEIRNPFDATVRVDAGPVPDPTGVRTALALYASKACAAARACCELDSMDTSMLANCEANSLEQLGADALASAVEANRVSFDSAGFGACITALDTIAPSCVAFDVSHCLDGFSGNQVDGAACVHRFECDPGSGSAVCVKAVGADTGTCTVDSHGVGADPCMATCQEANCIADLATDLASPVTKFCFAADDLVCSADTSVCVSTVAHGQPCGASWECVPTDYCDSDTGNCETKLADGATCASSSQCLSASRCTGSVCVTRRFASRASCEGGGLN